MRERGGSGGRSGRLRTGVRDSLNWRVAYAKRLARLGVEAGYDAIVWVSGLCYAAWITTDVRGSRIGALQLAGAVLVIGLLSVVCGLLAGLYRGRHQRGSLDEVFSVAIAGGLMLVPLVLLSGVLVGGQRDAVQTVAGGTLIALPTIAVARYVLYAARQRRGKPADGRGQGDRLRAGDAGIALITRLLAEPGAAYRPVALLDDDPDKRRLRVHGIPVRGDRTRMAEVAAATGATVLVIAIAKASGTVIRDLTARAEQCGLIPKVVPTTTELISGGARIEGVRDPRISDLLGRRPVSTDVAAIAGHFAGKRILVTGAGGSIGSELCRQLHQFAPAELIMLDRDESALHEVAARRCTGAPCSTPTRPCWPTSGTRAASARSSNGSARRSSSTPPRSSTCRCSSATRPRRCRATSSAPRRCSRPPPRAVSSRS